MVRNEYRKFSSREIEFNLLSPRRRGHMTRPDWLVGGDRRSEAAERIIHAASELVSRGGFDAFTIDALAAEVHCSPATIYRNVGGKAVILERVVQQMSMRIVKNVSEAIAGLDGPDRIVTAIVVALHHIRAEPLGPLMMGAIRPAGDTGWLTASPLVSDLAEHMIGRADPLAAQWLVRATLALWYWPVKDLDTEREIAARFVGPSVAAPGLARERT
jgi:AcrR family transcriptional regulator